MILIHIFKIENQLLSKIIVILTKDSQSSSGSLVVGDMNIDYKMYEKVYTVEELKELIAFYKSPVGKKSLQIFV